MVSSFLYAASMRSYVCVVQGNLSKESVAFLEQYRDTLKSRGYSGYANEIDDYMKGSFGSGFIIYQNNKPYIVTNKHVVAESETVNIKFENDDDSVSEYKELKVLAVDEDLDIALIKLPENFKKKGLQFFTEKLNDGDEVWSAGFPGLGNQPLWQFGHGTISNARAKIKELVSPEISTLIQHSAQVDPGNSGGPLLITDKKAEGGYSVVGINTWKAAYRESTNFSIPSAAILSFVKKTVSGNNIAGNINTRSAAFIKALNDKEMKYSAITKFVSNEMISKAGGDAFIKVISRAPTTTRNTVISIFGYDPIEGLKYSLAYLIWKEFQNDNGTAETEFTVGEKSSVGQKITFKADSKKEMESVWIEEQGKWRIKNFSSIENSKMSKKSSSDIDFSIYNPYILNVSVGVIAPIDAEGAGFELNLNYAARGLTNFGFYLDNVPTKFTYEEESGFSSNEVTESLSSKVFGAYFSLGIPMNFSKFCVSPYAQIRTGLANFDKFSSSKGESGLVFGIGGGVDCIYKLNSIIAPYASVEFMATKYMFKSTTSNFFVFAAGIKLFSWE